MESMTLSKAKSSVTGKTGEGLEEFGRAEILVGEIVEVWRHPESEKLYCEKVRVGPGEGQVRQIASGLRQWVTEEQMKGKVLVFANLKPRKLAGFVSEGMILCAARKAPVGEEAASVEICRPTAEAKVGERVYPDLEEFPAAEFETVLGGRPHLAAPSNSGVDNVLKQLCTDNEGRVVFRGKLLRTQSGPLQAHTLRQCPVS